MFFFHPKWDRVKRNAEARKLVFQLKCKENNQTKHTDFEPSTLTSFEHWTHAVLFLSLASIVCVCVSFFCCSLVPLHSRWSVFNNAIYLFVRCAVCIRVFFSSSVIQ